MTLSTGAALAGVVAGLAPAGMAAGDVPEVVALLRATPGIGFCEWEDEALLRRHLDVAPDLCLVTRDGTGKVVGALIGGSFGLRGTISHIAVSGPFRRLRVADRLVRQVMQAFRQRGVRRVFLFVLDGNHAADALWAQAGFRPTMGERTLECDL